MIVFVQGNKQDNEKMDHKLKDPRLTPPNLGLKAGTSDII